MVTTGGLLRAQVILVVHKLVYRRTDQAYRYLKNKLLLEIKKRGIQQLI